jgi:hypothetical protein
MASKSFLFISVSLKIRDKAEKLVKSNKCRMAKNINDGVDFLVVGDDKMDGWIKNNIYLPAKNMSSIKIIKYAEFENLFQKPVAENKSKTKKDIKSPTIKKSELVHCLWDIIGAFIYDHKYEIQVSKKEAEYLESQGLAEISKIASDSKAIVKIKVENFVDQNFKEDFAKHFNSNSLKGDKVYKTSELEKWMNKCFNNLHSLYSSFTVLGGEILFPEQGNNPWENSKTIYLEIPSNSFSLKELNKKWMVEDYFIEEEAFDSFKDDVLI